MIPIAKPIIEKDEIDAVLKVLETGMLAEGKVSREFENEFKAFIGTKHATVTSNGTTALSTALEALDIQPGDEVITTPFTFIASANTISMIGAIPVFVDVELDTYNIDPDLIKEAITEKTKAIMPVHIFGMPSDMKQIMEIAEEHDLLVIEDACQAHGASIDGKRVGSWGHINAFSFYATKNMMTGEGGMITTNDEELYEKALMIKNHGRGKQGGYSHFRIGFNSRMLDMVSALGRVQLKRIPDVMKKRRKNAERYDEFFSEVSGIEPQVEGNGFESAYHVYAPRLYSDKLDRNKMVASLREAEIGSRPVYALPCHKQDTYLTIQNWRWAGFVEYPDYAQVYLPKSEEIGMVHFEIPVQPGVTDENVDYITKTVKDLMS